MLAVDFQLLDFLNQYSHHSKIFDLTVLIFSVNNLLKGGMLIAIVWWAWFRPSKQSAVDRETLVSNLFGCVLAMGIARSLAILLPQRLRPLNESNLDFRLPFGMQPDVFNGWSSFPSDHAALFFTLSTGIVFVSRRVGAFAFFYTAIFICMPRLYFGLHYLTDILMGCMIGVSAGSLVNADQIKKKISQPALSLMHGKPGIFYPLFFLMTYQIVDMFDSSRALFTAAWEFYKYYKS